MTGPVCSVMRNLIIHTYTHTDTHTIPPWEDQREWHIMTRMTGPDCAVMCNLINTHVHTHTHTHTQWCLLREPLIRRDKGDTLSLIVQFVLKL